MLPKRTLARNYSENLSILWKGVWKTDASWHKQQFASLSKRRKANSRRFIASWSQCSSFSLSPPFFFLFYRDSTLLTPQAQSARRDSSSVVRFATPVTILWGIRYDRAYPFAHITHRHVRTCTRTRMHIRMYEVIRGYRECDTCRRHNKDLPTFRRSHGRALRDWESKLIPHRKNAR